jgi:AraC family L-rhamnose operon transcriptional activator RhaR/AraC family L-rhamnose operon regulatory protein RhaS
MELKYEALPFPEDFPFDIYRATGKKQPVFLHQHDFLEINLISSGRGVNFIDYRQYPMQEGDLFVINHREHHIAVSEGSLEMTVITFKPNLLGENAISNHAYLRPFFGDSPRENRIPLDMDNLNEIKSLVEKIWMDWREHTAGYQLFIRARMMELLAYIVKAGASEPETRRDSDREYERIRPALEWLNDHYAETVRLEKLAQLSCMSRTYFCDCFKKVMGVTTSRYLETLRINAACFLLKTETIPIIEIGALCGYPNVSNFNHAFKRVCGISPGAFRRQKSVPN